VVVTGTFLGAFGPEGDQTAELWVINHVQMHIVAFVVLVFGDIHDILWLCELDLLLKDLRIVHMTTS
jgi:hypothetical protein